MKNNKEKETKKKMDLPKKFTSPKLVPLSKSANLKDLECLAARGSSCSWK